jgi:hypothetical protein
MDSRYEEFWYSRYSEGDQLYIYFLWKMPKRWRKWGYLQPIRVRRFDDISLSSSALAAQVASDFGISPEEKKIDKHDIGYMMMRFRWKSISPEHYRMILRRVIGREPRYE